MDRRKNFESRILLDTKELLGGGHHLGVVERMCQVSPLEHSRGLSSSFPRRYRTASHTTRRAVTFKLFSLSANNMTYILCRRVEYRLRLFSGHSSSDSWTTSDSAPIRRRGSEGRARRSLPSHMQIGFNRSRIRNIDGRCSENFYGHQHLIHAKVSGCGEFP